ncbi:MAG: hypothetical protein LUG61_11555 [Lachnospiraceae bacterium]|nr:hypothetical protein [Lachnospiraceae bacterium]MCD7864109.1 hypothetical protein [Lachnospiraceae bacterium]
MSRKSFAILISLLCAALLGGCATTNSVKVASFEAQISIIVDSIEEINEKMNAIDTESDSADTEMLSYMKELSAAIDNLAALEIPSNDYQYVNDLALEAQENMAEALTLYTQILSSGAEYDPDVAETAFAYYQKACRRVSVIVSLLHGNTPSDVEISYE